MIEKLIEVIKKTQEMEVLKGDVQQQLQNMLSGTENHNIDETQAIYGLFFNYVKDEITGITKKDKLFLQFSELRYEDEIKDLPIIDLTRMRSKPNKKPIGGNLKVRYNDQVVIDTNNSDDVVTVLNHLEEAKDRIDKVKKEDAKKAFLEL